MAVAVGGEEGLLALVSWFLTLVLMANWHFETILTDILAGHNGLAGDLTKLDEMFKRMINSINRSLLNIIN